MSFNNNVSFPVDAVYLWVDGSDPQWLEKKNEIISDFYGDKNIQPPEDVISKGRFADNDELRYSLRSLSLYAPWIRNIYLVTDNQVPTWINRDKIRIVDHRDIFPAFAVRPCFNSHAIELCVHRIKGLSEHYLLMNDDVFFGSKFYRKDVFSRDGTPILWVVRKRKKYRKKLLSGDYMKMTAYRGADIFARRLVKERYGQYLPYRVRHYPKPMLCSMMKKIWNDFPKEVERTLSNHFRRTNDLAVFTFFTFYMIASHKAKPRSINGFRLVMDFLMRRVPHISATAGASDFYQRLDQIRQQRPLTFCVNDGEGSSEHDRQVISSFLLDLFFQKSIYEI